MAAPTYAVHDDVLTYTSKRGDVLTVDLDIPADILRSALATNEDDDQEQQFKIVAAWLGEDFEAAFDRMGVIERTRFSRLFFDEFTKAVRMPLGESQGSSSTSGSTEPSSAGTSES
ncbi:hypothetical protein ACIPVB_08935 [Microbacterium sp. NPDC090007]|uniref:hypothetical protein n=1 Tax=Microbacterium sp. NPDC090007 TaxID=3364204 RepID=UPI00382ECB9E